MARDSNREAAKALTERFRKAIAPFTTAHVYSSKGKVPGTPYTLAIQGARAKVGPDTWLFVACQFSVEDGEARIDRYTYILQVEDGGEILAYHLHPNTAVNTPHLHLKKHADVRREQLQGAHLPTGHLGPEDLHRLLTELCGRQGHG